MNNLVLHFDRRENQKSARLLLQLKNSYWFDYRYGEFTKSFGSAYPRWIKKQHKMPAAEIENWTLQQEIPMGIALQTKAGWKDIARLKTIGPLLNR